MVAFSRNDIIAVAGNSVNVTQLSGQSKFVLGKCEGDYLHICDKIYRLPKYYSLSFKKGSLASQAFELRFGELLLGSPINPCSACWYCICSKRGVKDEAFGA